VLDVDFVKSWIHEVALHNELWDSSSYFDSMGLILRSEMMWALICSNKAYLRKFLSIPTADLQYLTFMSWSKLCYVLISQIKAVLFLCESNSAPCNASTTASAMDSDSSSFTSQSGFRGLWDPSSAAGQADMHNIGAAMIEKLASVLPAMTEENGNRGAMFHFLVVLKSLIRKYEKQIHESEAMGREFRALSETNLEDRASLRFGGMTSTGMSPHNAELIPSADLGGANQEFVPNGDGDFDFGISGGLTDDMVWDTLLRDFTTMPLP
jgi:hypothetical protein